MSYQTLHDTVDTVLQQMADSESHALICIRVSVNECLTNSSTASFGQLSPLTDRFASQLDSNDLLLELEQNNFFILLNSANESRMVLVARLLRNSFNNGEHAGSNGTLSIGCVVFNRADHTGVELVHAVDKLATTAQGMKGGRILMKDLQCA